MSISIVDSRKVIRRQKSDEEFQLELLLGVSRTFALTIPQLPENLRNVVANAYLLCRAVDTIEDEPALNSSEKEKFCQWFTDVVDKKSDPVLFSNALAPLLSENTILMEHVLIKQIDEVLEITHSFDEPYQQAISRCVNIMSEGMSEFSVMDTSAGLPALKDMDQYCYVVAGVVGEMLTDLFCLQLPEELGPKKQEMMSLAPSFGQALQMTNILKDVWVDKSRGACWLPRDVFTSYGFDLAELENGQSPEEFQKGMLHLISIAYAHLKKAFEYTLMIPERESGIRKFCLWALLMSVLTIQKIRKNISDEDSTNWKISRPSVKRIMVTTELTVKQNRLLKLFFSSVSRGLTTQPTEFKA